MSVSVGQYIHELRHTVSVAGLNFEVWRALTGPESRPRFVPVMNRYSLFFQTAVHSSFVALLVALYRVYEKRSDTFNLFTFRDCLEQEASLTSELRDEIDAMIALAKPLWIKVTILRSKVFGHRSMAHTVEEAFAEADVTPNELEELLGITQRLMNAITRVVDDSVHAFNLGSGSATMRLLRDLERDG